MADDIIDSNGVPWYVSGSELPQWWVAEARRVADQKPYDEMVVRVKPDTSAGAIGMSVPPPWLRTEIERVASGGVVVRPQSKKGGGGWVVAFLLFLAALGSKRR